MRIIDSRRGSTFVLCLLSKERPELPRYPILPVRSCTGFERRSEPEGTER